MRNVLYPKLAATNIKKNGKTYFPYLLTCILTVMMFYDLLLVSTNSALDTMPGASQLRLILNFAVTITGGFRQSFSLYEQFLVRQRKKEMGLYQVLGMDKTNLTKMMVWESIYTAGAGILGGILAGIVFGRLIFLVLLKLIRFDVAFQFSVEPEAYFDQCRSIWSYLSCDSDLEHFPGAESQSGGTSAGKGKKEEKEPKANWLIAVIGILLLGSGYYIAQTTESPLSAIN